MTMSPPTVEYKRFHRGREGLPYYAPPDLITAFEVAFALGRPLLLTGEPGCGKTDFAWAAADAVRERAGLQQLSEEDNPKNHRVHECYVHSDARARDLLYSYDGLRRLADVQVSAADDKARIRAPNPGEYIDLQPLGLAMMLAADKNEKARPVVLLDEIDKASRDFPNDLLRELDRGGFEIVELTQEHAGASFSHGYALTRRMAAGGGGARRTHRPFVVITSNVERDLPDPFLRRCVFYHVEFPDPVTLDRIVKDHFDHLQQANAITGAPPDANQRAALTQVFMALRDDPPKLKKKPATSELIDWAEALVTAVPNGLSKLPASAEAIDWSKVPAIACLVKLREDRVRLGLSTPA